MEPIRPLRDYHDLPLHPNQEHLLLSREFFELQNRRLGPATVPSVLELSGPLHFDTIRGALQAIVARHGVLRTSFAKSGMAAKDRILELHRFATTGVFRPGMYQQSVADNVHLQLGCEDISSLTEMKKDEAIQARIASEAAQPLNHAHPPLLRAHLLKTRTDVHLLILMVDHLVMDAWSMRILRRELADLCQAQLPLRSLVRSTPQLCFADYTVWHQGALEQEHFGNSAGYWRRQWSAFSADRLGFEALPFALPKPATPSFSFVSETMSLNPELCSIIHAFTRKHGVTPYMLFLAAHAVLLSRKTGKQRVAIWGHFANRARPELHQVMGWFANTHLLGLDLKENPTWQAFLQHVRRVVLSAAEHQELPVSLIWRDLGAYPQDPDAKVLMDLVVADLPLSPSSDRTVHVQLARHLTPSFGRFSNLGLYIRDDGARYEAAIQYASDHFPAEALRDLLVEFQKVVEDMIQEPDSRIMKAI